MKQKTSILSMAGTLFTICLVCGGLLGLFHTLTASAIETKKEAVNQAAYRQVLPNASSFTRLELDIRDSQYDSIEEVYEAPEGYVIRAVGKGYAGDDIEMAVGLTRDGTVTRVSVISMSETPGLGARAKEESFLSQYTGKTSSQSLSVTSSGNPGSSQISAITGATRTSKGITDEINVVLSFYRSYLEGRQ